MNGQRLHTLECVTAERIAALATELLMASAAALGVLGYWLTSGSRRAATSPGLSA